MKFPYKHLIENISSKPDIQCLSEKLFQLGHEHEIKDDVFEMEFTPNRGDCLSLRGLSRDLNLFFEVEVDKHIYTNDISPLQFEFINNAKDSCKNISFLKVEIDQIPSKYNGLLESYFIDLSLNKNNFFTDVSNYISYETGQPTHCYDLSKIHSPIKLEFLDCSRKFLTLLDKTIDIEKKDLVFYDKNSEVINLAGIVGGKNTACSGETKSVIIECAYFDPEIIMGKSVKYDINSEAAHKFERNVDINCHEYVLRRLLWIINQNANITNIELFTEKYDEQASNSIPFDAEKINKILGTQISNNQCIDYLTKLGFLINKKMIEIPSYRSDINDTNDLAEEVARAIGYDNLITQESSIFINNNNEKNIEERKLKNHLISLGFYEVINDPFVSAVTSDSAIVDNPLDSTRKYLRTDLKQSLLKNLSYNERRQQDSIKLFEVSDIYLSKSKTTKKVFGIIASGRIGKNYQDFSKNIDSKYFEDIFNKISAKFIKFEEIPRESVNSKSKGSINYVEIIIDSSFKTELDLEDIFFDIHGKNFTPISDFPSSNRDLSFLIGDYTKCKNLEESILSFKHYLLKEVYVFDYYKNDKLKEIKIGFRFIFQSKDTTITDKDVNAVMELIIKEAQNIDSVSIPGLQ